MVFKNTVCSELISADFRAKWSAEIIWHCIREDSPSNFKQLDSSHHDSNLPKGAPVVCDLRMQRSHRNTELNLQKSYTSLENVRCKRVKCQCDSTTLTMEEKETIKRSSVSIFFRQDL